MNQYYIYVLERGDNTFYVGYSIDIEQRFKQHKVKFGSDISIKVVDSYYGSDETARALEDFWIKKYKDLGIPLVNIQQYGDKRVARSYKISDLIYFKAMERAKNEGTTLSELIEQVVTQYSEGHNIIAFKDEITRALKIQ